MSRQGLIDISYDLLRDTSHPLIDSMRDLQDLRSSHSSLSLSNLSSASSVSLIPTSFFRFLSEQPPVHCRMGLDELLIRCPLLYLLRRDPKNTEDVYHYLGDYMRHCRRRWHFSVNFGASERAFEAFEDVDKSVFAFITTWELQCCDGPGSGIKNEDAMRGGHRHRRRSPSQARIPVK